MPPRCPCPLFFNPSVESVELLVESGSQMVTGLTVLLHSLHRFYSIGDAMDAVLRFSLFLTLASLAFLLLTPAMINALNFWTRVFNQM